MNTLEAALRRLAADLGRHHRAWALVGGFAVSARAEPRFTRDIDVAVSVEGDSDGETLTHSLVSDGYRVLASIEQEETARLATVRLACPVGSRDVVADLLFASSGIETEIAKASEMTEVISGLTLPIATTGHLIALKLLARDDQERPQDLADLRALKNIATREDWRSAQEAVRLIAARGYNRERDLLAALDTLSGSC